MGIDYIPFDVLAGSDELPQLIQVQTTALRSMPYFWFTKGEVDPEITEQLVALHKATCMDAGRRICSNIRMYNDESFRVYPITRNYALPPCVRHDALSSFLPEQAAQRVATWRKWVDEMRKDEYRPYLKELFLNYSITYLKERIHTLQETVRAFEEQYPGKLEKELLLRILLLNTNFSKFLVQEFDAPRWFQTNHASTVDVRFDAYIKYYNLVRYCLYSYSRCASNKWKVGGMIKDPFQEFQTMLDSHIDKFLDWADTQTKRGRGFYLSW